ncbi:MAG: D-alanyl-D-alanine carboxypeptidase/D-alanyl-D-alanine-endopeptidase [Planctomycetes bacterium]|nr:D-alanyl-D-alanine carboxypeptidase/D-alanyl-D-alanine-endopeptidase [Planctomycetota bacterium]
MAVLWLSACSHSPSLQRETLSTEAAALGASLHVCVLSTNDAEPLVEQHSRLLFNPASTAKLLTACATLSTAPANAVLTTQVRLETTDPSCNTLVLVGGGDPLLTSQDLQSLAAECARRIGPGQHKLAADSSHFSGAELGRGWMWDDELDMLRASSLRLHEKNQSAPAQQTLAVFHAALPEELRARVALLPDEHRAQGTVLARLYRPLLTVLRATLESSDNVAAECLLRQLPHWSGHDSGTAEQGFALLRTELQRCGIDDTQLVLADGSGFSRYNLLHADALAHLLLRHEQEHPGRLRALLPRAGESGSLMNRFIGTNAVGRVQAKTGSLEGVSALAGYLTTLGGRELTFCVVLQHSHAKAVTLRALLDRVVLALLEESY